MELNFVNNEFFSPYSNFPGGDNSQGCGKEGEGFAKGFKPRKFRVCAEISKDNFL
jgi:hypothetical protein